MFEMLKLEIPHIQVNNRGKYSDVYFKVHPKDRPDGWAPSIHLGRTDRQSKAQITQKAEEVYNEYLAYLTGDDSIKEGSFPDLIRIYKGSGFWNSLSDKTKSDYESYLKEIHKWSRKNNHPHISRLTVKDTVKWLNTFKDTPVRQRRAKTVLSRVCAIAFNEGLIEANFVKEIELEKRQTEKRPITIWSEEELDSFVAECDARGLFSLGSMAITCIETIQRQVDIAQMVNGRDWKDGKLVYIQSKTKKKVRLPPTDKLKERYEKVGMGDYMMFIRETTGKPWRTDAITKMTREVCDYLGMTTHIFAHLRHSQINYLFELEVPIEQMVAITGQNEETLKQYYRESRNEKLATEGIAHINRERKKRSHTKRSHKSHTK